MTKQIAVGTAIFLASAVPAVAQVVVEDAARTIRDSRRDGRDLRAMLRAAEPEKPVIHAQIGVAYDDDEHDTRTWSTPFSLSYQTPGSEWWRVQLRGDGYARVKKSAGASLSGVSDLQLNLLHPIVPKLIGYVGVTAPTHGDVGSTHWSQRVKLSYGDAIAGPWSYLAIGGVSRSHVDAAGISRYATSIYFEGDYDLGQKQTLFAAMARGQRHGAGGSTELSLGYDFPIASKIQGTLSLARGISKGARHTGAEVDLDFAF